MESIETKIAPQVEVLLDLLVENEDNPRTCTEENFGKLRKSLERDGDFLQLEDILVYEKEGKYHVIGGNHRVRVLREKKTKKVSVTVFNDVHDGEGNLDERKFWEVCSSITLILGVMIWKSCLVFSLKTFYGSWIFQR